MLRLALSKVLQKRAFVSILGALLGTLLAGGLGGCLPVVQSATSVHLLLGNPSGAIASVTAPDNYLIERPQYALSFNRSRNILNWASWQLNRDWLGNLPRSEFQPDRTLPQGWYQVTPRDYTGSGFDRGHTVPASDRNRSPEDSQSVFLMTNIFPQAPDNNQGPWQAFEVYCRDLVRRDQRELYIIAGSTGVGGSGERGKQRSVGQGKITVPAQVWKVVLVLEPGAELRDVTQQTQAIAVIMPNQQGIRDTPWQRFRVSVDDVEQLTGYDFFSNLPRDVQAAIEARVD